uniref:Uncharacterized protein n=1 Tax=viral metagenome TaxID=1070528 RepID=A0A6C0C6L3_9ZZZZ
MKLVQEINLYSDTHLPIHGWLQGCWECKSITSRSIIYKKVDQNKVTYKYIVYLCNSCKKQMNYKAEKKEDFYITCDEFIDNHLETSRT